MNKPAFFQIVENLKRGPINPDGPKPPVAEHPLFGPVIHSYTRAEAIADGVLFDLGTFVSDQGIPVLELVGIRFPVAITSAAYELVLGERDFALLPDAVITRRVIYFLAILKRAILAHRGKDTTLIEFTCTNAELKPIALKAICGPGDDAEPVITVMLPGED